MILFLEAKSLRGLVLIMQFNRLGKLFLTITFVLCGRLAYAQINDKTLTYDQSIQIISNLSDVNSQRIERLSLIHI